MEIVLWAKYKCAWSVKKFRNITTAPEYAYLRSLLSHHILSDWAWAALASYSWSNTKRVESGFYYNYSKLNASVSVHAGILMETSITVFLQERYLCCRTHFAEGCTQLSRFITHCKYAFKYDESLWTYISEQIVSMETWHCDMGYSGTSLTYD